MHDIKWIESNEEAFKKALGHRKIESSRIDMILGLNKDRKERTFLFETKKAELNRLSKEIGILKKNGGDTTQIMNQVSQLKEEIPSLESNLEREQEELTRLLSELPNMAAEDVPVGGDEHANVEVHRHGTPRTFSFTPKDHVQLGEELGLLDFEAGVKLTGSRFVVYKGALAKLERALINFMLDEHTAAGCLEILPPYIVNSDSLYGTGQLPKFGADLFKLENSDWYLIPTAEVPVTNLRKKELFSGTELPLRYCSYTPCFRSEAGSYGKDTKGIIRLHQFNKVELVTICAGSESVNEHEKMIKRAESILEKLGLPYRAMLLCTGDMGFGARKCIDLEVWLPGQDKYREISSISNCGEFQARRAQIRYRGEDGKPQFAHTLNGSGLAVGRTLVAILENYQEADGSIRIPEALVSYMGGLEIIKK